MPVSVESERHDTRRRNDNSEEETATHHAIYKHLQVFSVQLPSVDFSSLYVTRQ